VLINHSKLSITNPSHQIMKIDYIYNIEHYVYSYKKISIHFSNRVFADYSTITNIYISLSNYWFTDAKDKQC